MIFDTTSCNTGRFSGACITIKGVLLGQFLGQLERSVLTRAALLLKKVFSSLAIRVKNSAVGIFFNSKSTEKKSGHSLMVNLFVYMLLVQFVKNMKVLKNCRFCEKIIKTCSNSPCFTFVFNHEMISLYSVQELFTKLDR